MLDPNKIEPDRVYLNISTGEVATGDQLRSAAADVHLADWVDKDDAGKGRKYDTGKPDWGLVPADELEDVVKVFTMGSEKYGRENWKSVENGMFRYYGAMMRHIKSYKRYMETGDKEELYDSESGLHHLAHAMTNAIFLMWLDNNVAHKFKEGDKPNWWEEMELAATFDIEQAILADADPSKLDLGYPAFPEDMLAGIELDDCMDDGSSEIVDAPKDQNPYAGGWPDDVNYVVNFNMEND